MARKVKDRRRKKTKKCEMGRDKYEIKTLKNLYNISSHMLTYQNIILSLIFSKSYFKYLKI